MPNNGALDKIKGNNFGFKKINISSSEMVDGYLFMKLDNGQRIITDGTKIYDVSEFNHFHNVFTMENKLCAVLSKAYTRYVIDLNTKEVLFDDKNADFVTKQDERTLHVIMKIYRGNDKIYNIETRKYLPSPEDYEFEKTLGNNLYVFREKNSKTNFYDLKRCIINADGKFILKDICGYVESKDNFLIVKKEKEIHIYKNNEGHSVTPNIIRQTEEMLAKPEYSNGNLIIMVKGMLKIFDLDFKLVREFEVSELDSVIDYEVMGDTIKIRLPYKLNEKDNYKEIFVNLNNGKSISHVRINGYPYWNHETVVGKDGIDDEGDEQISKKTVYHFYDSNLNKKFDIEGNYCLEINDSNAFIVGIYIDSKNIKRVFINTATNTIIDNCVYDIMHFLQDNIGYGFNTLTDKMDIIDDKLNVIIPNIDYKKLGLLKCYDAINGIRYFTVNDYVCITMYVDYGGPHNLCRKIIQNANGDIILDSVEHECFAVGNYIQITKDGESEFLNTLTGEKGKLCVTAPTDKGGKIDFEKVNNGFQIQDTKKLLLEK